MASPLPAPLLINHSPTQNHNNNQVQNHNQNHNHLSIHSPTKPIHSPDPSYIDPLIALAPTPANLSALARSIDRDHAPISSQAVEQVFTSAFISAASTGDCDLIEWLLAKPSQSLTALPRPSPRLNHSPVLQSCSSSSNLNSNLLPPGQPRRWLNLDATDIDGSPPIVLAAAFGHAEAVRAIVDGIGGDVVDSRDPVGWTALHWAARNGDFTIVSYLLNHGASTSLVSFTDRSLTDGRPLSIASNPPSRRSSYSSLQSVSIPDPSNPTPQRLNRTRNRHRGLRPYDLTKPDQEGHNIRQILRMADEAKQAALPSRPHSRASVHSARIAEARSDAEMALAQINQAIQLAKLSATTLEIDPSLLGLSPEPKNPFHCPIPSLPPPRSRRTRHQSVRSDWENEQRAEKFEWDRCLPDQMLVCSLGELEMIFEAVIKTVEPRQSRPDRFMPVNVIFLCARFAGHFGSEELLEEVLLGSMDRIEEVIFARQENMAYSTFWLFNAICLLYYLHREPHLNVCSAELQPLLRDLINEIFVFIIRDAERRLDKLLDPALLDFEAAPTEPVEFEPEGSWAFVKALTGKRNRTSSNRAPIPSYQSSVGSLSPPVGGHGLRTKSLPGQVLAGVSSPGTGPCTGTSPRQVTDILSGVLYLLQAYEIHSSVVVQTFAQIFYWLGCELFNRIIARRKYLCRSKAHQIGLNVAVLVEWARANGLPPLVTGQYFGPLEHLLRWLGCLSQVTSFDSLVETMSTLKSLNPVQMLKASREYRFEAGEPRMAEECRQCLVQAQQDWDRRRIQRAQELEERERAECDMSGPGAAKASVEAKQAELAKQAVEAIDRAFTNGGKVECFEPPTGPECLGELLDSRHMLPFAMPSSTEVLMRLKRTVPFGPIKTYSMDPVPGDMDPLGWSDDGSLSGSESEEELDESGAGGGSSEESGAGVEDSRETKNCKRGESPDSSVLTDTEQRRSRGDGGGSDKEDVVDGVVPIVSGVVLKRLDQFKK